MRKLVPGTVRRATKAQYLGAPPEARYIRDIGNERQYFVDVAKLPALTRRKTVRETTNDKTN